MLNYSLLENPLNSFREGQEVSVPLNVTEDDMRSFASLSKDLNPLHQEESFARAHGFAGRVVYGGLLVAAVSRLLGMKLPGKGWVWHSVAMQFHSPLYVGEPAEVRGVVKHLNDDIGVIQISLQILRSGQVIAKGEAQAGRLKAGTLPERPAS